MVAPEAVICVKVGAAVLTFACVVFRYIILRKQSDVITFRSNLSHLALVVACVTDFVSAGLSVYVLVQEINMSKHFSGADLNAHLATVKNGIVFFYTHLFYYITILIIKLGYLLFYAELYVRAQATRRYPLPVATAIWATSSLTGIFVIYFWCAPFTDNWNPHTKNPHCPLFYSIPAPLILGIMNIISDIAILIVPILLVSTLKVSRLEKRALFIIFAVGGTSIASSIIRLIVVIERLKEPDNGINWETPHAYMLWSQAEVFFGMLAFTLPGFRYLFRKRFGKYGPAKGMGGGYPSNGYGTDTYRSRIMTSDELELDSEPGINRIGDSGRGGALSQEELTKGTNSDYEPSIASHQRTMLG